MITNNVFKVVISILLASFLFAVGSEAWRAIPANQAAYALRGYFPKQKKEEPPDDDLPRTFLHSVYKFGYCTPDATKLAFFRKQINVTLPTWESTQASYMHLLVNKHSIRYALQCVVMKAYVPRKYQFLKSRLPLYYCQGIALVMMLNTVQKLEIHEFYLKEKLNLPVNFVFEFYHPIPL